jgi:hypothetical protein
MQLLLRSYALADLAASCCKMASPAAAAAAAAAHYCRHARVYKFNAALQQWFAAAEPAPC